MKNKIFFSWAVGMVIVFLCTQVMAQVGRIHFGKLNLIPEVELQYVYDDNIYLGNGSNNTDELKESDWIFHVKPAVFLGYSLGERGGVKLGYLGNFAYYADNNDNDWKNNRGVFELDYEAPGGLIVGINEVYTDSEDPYGSLSEYKLGTPVKRWYNDLDTKIGFNFSNRFKALCYYNFYKQDYARAQDFTQDYYVNEFGVGGQIKILPKTWGFIRYHYGERDYFSHPSGTGVTDDNDADHDWNRINAGLTWEPGGKLLGELNFGYQWLDFENAVDATNNKYHNVNTWIATTSVDYAATSTTHLELNIARTPRTTNAARNEYYDDTSVGLNLQQGLPFLPKLTLSAGVRYSNNDYNRQENRRRKDDNWFADIVLNYHIQDWLRAGVGYNYKTKDSNQGEYDYTDNQFMISLGAAY